MTTVEEYLARGKYTSGLVKTLLQSSGVSTHVAASMIGVSDELFRKKLSRNKFSYHEVMLIADKCGFKIEFNPQEHPNVT